MKKAFILSLVFFFGSLFIMGCEKETREQVISVTIGTGGITGVYYPAGGAIARVVNEKEKTYGIRCAVESSAGSVVNINGIMAGRFQFGIAQSDKQYQAYKGLKEWQEKGPQKNLRAVFSLHPESLTLCAAVDADIRDIRDLRGKRVNIGNLGAGLRGNTIDALTAVGINYETDIIAESHKAPEAPGLLQKGKIDAFFYTVGHPSGAFKEATEGERKVRLVSITGVEALLAEYPYYAKSIVPIKFYPGAENDSDVETFGVKATVVTSSKVPEKVVYSMTKAIFENIHGFKNMHPAFQGLTKKGMLEGLSAPIHPGAMKYYKEAGLK